MWGFAQAFSTLRCDTVNFIRPAGFNNCQTLRDEDEGSRTEFRIHSFLDSSDPYLQNRIFSLKQTVPCLLTPTYDDANTYFPRCKSRGGGGGGVICPNSTYTAQAGTTMLLSVWLLGSLFQVYAQ